jgi:hypothetical protein
MGKTLILKSLLRSPNSISFMLIIFTFKLIQTIRILWFCHRSEHSGDLGAWFSCCFALGHSCDLPIELVRGHSCCFALKKSWGFRLWLGSIFLGLHDNSRLLIIVHDEWLIIALSISFPCSFSFWFWLSLSLPPMSLPVSISTPAVFDIRVDDCED